MKVLSVNQLLYMDRLTNACTSETDVFFSYRLTWLNFCWVRFRCYNVSRTCDFFYFTLSVRWPALALICHSFMQSRCITSDLNTTWRQPGYFFQYDAPLSTKIPHGKPTYGHISQVIQLKISPGNHFNPCHPISSSSTFHETKFANRA